MGVIFYSTVHFARMAESCGSAMKQVVIALFVASVSKFWKKSKTRLINPKSSFNAFLATER